MRFDEMLISGCDSAGADMAVALRRKIGAGMLDELRRLGLRDLTIQPAANDEEWGSVFTLGEEKVPVTPTQLSAFLAAIATDGGHLLSAGTARQLRSALEGVVQRGTASGIKDALSGTGWALGGKTGTGPGQCGDACDGWFASILSDAAGGRYVILAFIEHKGLGGGAAAQAAAKVAGFLAYQPK